MNLWLSSLAVHRHMLIVSLVPMKRGLSVLIVGFRLIWLRCDGVDMTAILRDRQARGIPLPDVKKRLPIQPLRSATTSSITTTDTGLTGTTDVDPSTGLETSIIPASTSSPSSSSRTKSGVDWESARSNAVKGITTGGEWLQAGRQILKSDMGVSLGWKGKEKSFITGSSDTVGEGSGTVGMVREMNIGKGGYGLTIRARNAVEANDFLTNATCEFLLELALLSKKGRFYVSWKEFDDDLISLLSFYFSAGLAFLAAHNNKSGTLSISPAGIHFASFLAASTKSNKKKASASAQASIVDDDVDGLKAVISHTSDDVNLDGSIPANDDITKNKDPTANGTLLEVAMEDISGMRKTNVKKLMVVIASGIDVEMKSGKVSWFSCRDRDSDCRGRMRGERYSKEAYLQSPLYRPYLSPLWPIVIK